MNERVNPFKKLQKPGKHAKRIVIGAAGLVIIAGLAGDATYQIQEQEQAVLAALHHRHTGIGRTKINADHFAHTVSSVSCPPCLRADFSPVMLKPYK